MPSCPPGAAFRWGVRVCRARFLPGVVHRTQARYKSPKKMGQDRRTASRMADYPWLTKGEWTRSYVLLRRVPAQSTGDVRAESAGKELAPESTRKPDLLLYRQ